MESNHSSPAACIGARVMEECRHSSTEEDGNELWNLLDIFPTYFQGLFIVSTG